MRLPSVPRWAKLTITISVVILLVVVGSRGCGNKKPVAKSDSPAATMDKKPDTKPEPPTTTAASTLQRIESAIAVIQTGLADLAKELANLNSRVEILEKRLVPRVTSGTGKKTVTSTVSKLPPSTPPVPSTTEATTTAAPPLATTLDLTPVERGLREGLGEIAEAIKETHTQLPVPTPVVHATESSPTISTPISDNPCANWAPDPTRYRRCRLYNQLP